MNTILRTLTPVLALSLAAPSLLAADGVLIVEKRTAGGTTTTTQIQIEKTRMRAEVPGPTGATQVVVFDATADVMRMIDAGNKTYTEITKADVDRMGGQMSGAMAQLEERMKSMPPEQRERMEAAMRGRGMGAPAAPPKPTYRKNGTDKVGKWTCDKYDGFQNDQKVSELCTVDPAALGLGAADFDVTRQMAAFFQKLSPQGARQLFTIGSAEQGYSGVPVRSIMSIGPQQTTIELTEVTRKSFSDDSYAVPAGFEKRPSPFAGRGRQ
jgi:hypothetical protein